MLQTDLKLPRRTWLFIILVLFLFTGYFIYFSFTTPLLGSSDQVNIGVMVNKLINPELYSRDYVFKDTSLFEFYTPTFLNSVVTLTKLTGRFEYALAVFVPIMMLVYLVGMFLLLYFVSVISYSPP